MTERLGLILEMYFYGKSDTGKVRNANQDTYIICELCKDSVLCVVCDGMGGAKSGNVASETAAEIFTEKIKKYTAPKIDSQGNLSLNSDEACIILDDALHEANAAVYKKSQSDAKFNGMGTTLVAAICCREVVYVINVGDSRLYLISDNTISQITHDHSYVQHLIDNGSLTAEDARTHPYRNRITRAVGVRTELEADIFSIDLSELKMCCLLLCSDGLSSQLQADDIYSIITSGTDTGTPEGIEAELAAKTEELIGAANAAGGPDNITAVLVKYTQNEKSDPIPAAD